MKRRVLVVDDDELIVEILSTILDLEEFEVATASSGEQALDKVATDPPHVVVLDVMMPGLDGLEVCRRLKKQETTQHLPVVLLTARDRDEDRDAGMAAGADAYLTKPFSPLALIDTISEVGAWAREGA